MEVISDSVGEGPPRPYEDGVLPERGALGCFFLFLERRNADWGCAQRRVKRYGVLMDGLGGATSETDSKIL